MTKVKCPDAKDIIGIATESGRRSSGSEDIVYFDARDWTSEQQYEVEQMMAEFAEKGVLGKYVQYEAVEKEYPDIPISAQRQLSNLHCVVKGRDRNAPCPCGSGKKYKKCHGDK